jgi:DNA-binding LacI/PurR family transcriptional regulator
VANTIVDVAKRAGASPSTVSRVLNRKGYVSEEMREKVERAALELGYQPNWQARALKGKASGLVGLIIPDISNTYYTAVAQGVAGRLRAHDYEPVLCVNNEDPVVDLHYLQILQQKRVDGILYAHPAAGSNWQMVEAMVRGGMPIVEINRQHAPDLLDAVVADNYLGAYQMTEHLLALGHTRIGLVLGETQLITGNRRLAGYRRAHEDAGVRVDPCLVRVGSFIRQHGETATRELLSLPERPTALFAGSNRILMGCLAVISELDISIPGELSIGSFDNTEWMSAWRPPITAVDIAIDELSRLAVDLLLRRIAEGDACKPVTYTLSTSLIRRASTAAPPEKVERVPAALRHGRS